MNQRAAPLLGSALGRTIAAYGLEDGPRTISSRPLADGEWVELVDAACGHGLVGILGKAVGSCALATTEHQRVEVHQLTRRYSFHVLGLELALTETVARLTED